jgi:hypothetical protein
MTLHKLALLAGLLTTTLGYAQDNIILRNGEEIPAKVLEVSPTELKYRKTANPDGPIYISPVRDVLLIKYANGTKDVMATQPNVPQPRATRRPGRNRQEAVPATSLEQLRYQSRLFNRHFENGNGQRLSRSELGLTLRPLPGALLAYERGQSLRTWSAIAGGSGLALIGVGAALAVSDRNGWGSRGDRYSSSNNMNDRGGFGRNNRRVGAALVGSGVLLGLTSVWLNHRATVQFRRAANQYNQRTPVSLRFQPSAEAVGAGATLTF